MRNRIIPVIIIVLLLISSVTCSFVTGDSPTLQPDSGGKSIPETMAALQGTRVSLQATLSTLGTPSVGEEATIQSQDNQAVGTGSISGNLSYPAETIPPLRVTAFQLETGDIFSIETVQDQKTYTIANLPSGTYHVVAYAEGQLAGGYSQAVPCGLSVDCNDHGLIEVDVAPGQAVTGVNPGDWYAPEGIFPPNPMDH